MGYYSSLETNAMIDSSKLEKLKEAIKKEIKSGNEMAYYWLKDDFLILEPDKDGVVVLDFQEYYCKHYEDNMFIKFIHPFLNYEYRDSFYYFRFYGEDNYIWGYKVYKDKIVEIEADWKEVE